MAEPWTCEFVALDLETTGLFAESDRVVEVGAVRFTAWGEELGRYERLINPERPMSPAAQSVHGISDADLSDEAPAREVLPEFVAFLGDRATTRLLAHNARFDAGFLGHEIARNGLAWPGHAIIDTLPLARSRLPSAPDHRLDTLSRVLGLHSEGSHRALADSLRVMGLWIALTRGQEPPARLVSFPVFELAKPEAVPKGWDRLVEAIAQGHSVRMNYAGRSRGSAPREITPRYLAHHAGVSYLVALCHLDDFEKSFRLDRIQNYEVV